jgi:phenylacetate-CoA ligase
MISEPFEFAGLLRRRGWSRARLDDLRRAKLQRLVRHAYENVPYYRALMERAGVTPGDLAGPADLARLPVTTKADLRRAGGACLARGHGELMTLHTSGHTGVPFEVRLTPAEYRTRRLREFRMLIAAGVRPRDRLTLLGPIRTRPPRLHRLLGFYRLEVISGMLPAGEQLRRLRDSRPDVLWVYPSVLKGVLFLAQCELHELARPRFLITSASVMEPVFREQLLAANPGLEIVDIYGSAEAGRIAATCSVRRGLHLEDDALIVELLDEGRPAAPDAHGTVVITCLDQLAMPLIRYEQGDLGRLLPDGCSCGRQTPLLEPPIGRSADMITLPSGRKVSYIRLEVALRHETALLEYRFVQESLQHIEAQLCFKQDPPAAKIEEIRRCLEQYLEEGQTLTVRVVPEMQFEGTKFKVFVSKLGVAS